MHVIPGGRDLLHAPLYKKRRTRARPDSLSAIFHRLRIHRNLTRKSLALRFQVSEEYISSIEDGRKFGSIQFYLRCATLYGANPNWVKSIWAKEAINRYSDRLRAKLCLDN